MNPRRLLVISPHADDEVLGCGGTIARSALNGYEVTLVIMAMGGAHHYHLPEAATLKERDGELKASSRTLGIARTRLLFPGRDMRLESVPMLEMVTALDKILAETSYDVCYLPEPSHNLDHRLTHEASLTALRPCGRRPFEMVAAYEGTALGYQPAHSSGWLYVNIVTTLEQKLAALRHYRSQIRNYPHPSSEEAVRRIAAMRGLECGVDFAERFRVLRATQI